MRRRLNSAPSNGKGLNKQVIAGVPSSRGGAAGAKTRSRFASQPDADVKFAVRVAADGDTSYSRQPSTNDLFTVGEVNYEDGLANGGCEGLRIPATSDGSAARLKTSKEGCVNATQPSTGDPGSHDWSNILRTPSEGEFFSPSKESSEAGNLHGLGFRAASERAKTLAACGKRSSRLLAELSSLHDSFARSTLKACVVTLSPKSEIRSLLNLSSATSKLASETNRCLSSLGKETQGLAIVMKGTVARPYYDSSSAIIAAVNKMANQYALSRDQCANARQSALRERSRYVAAVKDTETAIRGLKIAREKTEEAEREAKMSERNYSVLHASSDRSWEAIARKFGEKHGSTKSSHVVRKALEKVRRLEGEYLKLVEEENLEVSVASKLEITALASLQKLEKERLLFLMKTIDRALQAEKGALDSMHLTAQTDFDDEIDLSAPDDGSSPVVASLKSAASTVNTSGSTLNPDVESTAVKSAVLPEEVERRDEMKEILTIQLKITRAVKTISQYFDDISIAALTFANGVQSKLANEGYAEKKNATTNSLSKTLNASEGDRALHCWNEYVKSQAQSARSALDFATKVQSVAAGLSKHFQSAEKDLKSAIQNEETRWSHCDRRGKSEARARLQFEQCADALEKAQIQIIEADREYFDKKEEPMSFTQSDPMTMALNGMWALLPDGDAQQAVSKILNVEQRFALAKNGLKEAAERERKAREALEVTQAAKKRAIDSYVDAAKAAHSQASTSINVLLGLIAQDLESILSLLQHFREERYDSLEPATTKLKEFDGSFLLNDMVEWGVAMRGILESHREKTSFNRDLTSSPGGNPLLRYKGGFGPRNEHEGFLLRVRLVDSATTYKLLEFGGEESDGQEEVDTTTNTNTNRNLSASSAPVTPSSVTKRPLSIGNASLMSGPSLPDLSMAAKARISDANRELRAFAGRLKDAAADSPFPYSVEASTVAPGQQKSSADSEIFIAHFGRGAQGNANCQNNSTPPTVIDSFSCAYWPNEKDSFISPLLHGRLFATSSAMYGIFWGDKKLILKWSDVDSVQKESIGPLDNSLRISFNEGKGESSYFFGSFAYGYREKAYQLISKLVTLATSLAELADGKRNKKKNHEPAVPTDEILSKMEHILSRRLRNTSIKKFYDTCWSDGNDTGGGSFYHNFLSEGAHDVKVEKWEVAKEGSNGFVHQWSNESFDQKRMVAFKFTRTTHLYIGPPVAVVDQTQYCRIEGDDKLVLSMTVKMHGIPYSDCFAVEVRWLARRAGPDLIIDVGVFVDFKKNTMLRKKIQSGTVTETKPIHVALFKAAKEACSAGDDEDEDDEGEEEKRQTSKWTQSLQLLQILLKWLLSLVANATTSVARHPRQISISVLFVLFLFFLAGRYFVATSVLRKSQVKSDQTLISTEFLSLEERIDNVQKELREMQILLKSLIEKSRENDSTGKL